MIDWLKVRIPYEHDQHNRIIGGHFIDLDPDGSINWAKDKTKKIENPSHRASVQVMADGRDYLEIDGNPTKWFLGHNCYGKSNYSIIKLFIQDIINRLGVKLSPLEQAKLINLEVDIYRIDITNHFALESLSQVEQVIRLSEHTAYTKRSRAVLTGSTLYFNKKSEYWAFKAYSKHLELKHRRYGKLKAKKPIYYQQLLDYTEKQLRLELTLRRKQFTKQLGIETIKDLKQKYPDLNQLFNQFNKEPYITWGGKMEKLNDNKLETMPRSLRKHYEVWLVGVDLKAILSESQFRRIRNKLRDEYGVDVSFPRKDGINTFLDVKDVIIEAKPVIELPQFAVNDHYFDLLNSAN